MVVFKMKNPFQRKLEDPRYKACSTGTTAPSQRHSGWGSRDPVAGKRPSGIRGWQGWVAVPRGACMEEESEL